MINLRESPILVSTHRNPTKIIFGTYRFSRRCFPARWVKVQKHVGSAGVTMNAKQERIKVVMLQHFTPLWCRVSVELGRGRYR